MFHIHNTRLCVRRQTELRVNVLVVAMVQDGAQPGRGVSATGVRGFGFLAVRDHQLLASAGMEKLAGLREIGQ